MTTLFPEIEHGEGGDTAAQGGTVLPVAFGKPDGAEADQAGPQTEVAAASSKTTATAATTEATTMTAITVC